ncbi:Ig-like domain-containing protein [Treponema sp. OMZ 788]|uniref:InlB B-repeat-containing protein n=1 Tax=Treponema sp. OMZ 788 TaxID=2563664 RepID=UPI0020A5574A|nr:Ig-like domain-containing protein [Treponema sp. OMZ 788]UTC65021.1 Ig-like domain-containing protein [Treponema sp. OMZ 788]
MHNKNGIKVTLKFIKEKADLNLKAEANGTLQAAWSGNTETVAENGTKKLSIEKGTTVELKAIPNTGYEFANWTKIPNPKTNPNIITVTENIEISAKFKKIIPVPKYIKLNGYTVDLTDWKVSVPNSLKAINQAEGKFTAGAAEITPSILIENNPVSLTEGAETEVTLKIEGAQDQYGEWKQTIKVKCLSPSDLPDLILKSLKVHGEAADLTSMSVSVPNDKETITSANIKAVFFRFSEEIQNIQVTQDPVSINLTVGEPASITLSVAEKSGEGGYKAWTQTLSVTRKKLPVTGVELSAATLDLEVGEQHKLTATVQPSNATNQNVEWRSDNNAAASVEQNGTVTAKGPGTAKITVKTLDGNFEKTCTVNVIQKFTVNFAVEGSGGTVEVKAGENEVTNSSKLQADTLLKFTAIPEEGFEILNWEGISVSPANAAAIQHQLTEDLNVKVKFKQKTYKVIFEANGGIPEPEKQTISHGDKITEPSSITKAGNDLEGWYTDDKFTSKWNFETDKVTDNIRLYAKWEKKKITVKFDTDKIKAFLNRLGSELGNDDKVFIGDKIYLSAFPLEEGKKPSWIINGKPSSSIKPYASPVGFPHLYEYTVKEEDADNRIIRFDYTPAMAEKLTIDYDNSVKRIFISEKGAPEITKGSQVDEGKIIVIEAKFDEGMIIDQCLVNGKPASGEIIMRLFGYKISTADADSNKMLNFSCTPKTPSTGTVHWDNEKSRMTCEKQNQHGPNTSITNGEQVQEGDALKFTADIDEGEILDKWLVNGIETETEILLGGNRPNEFNIIIKTEHISKGTLTISYSKKKLAKGNLQWNETENPMTCTKRDKNGHGTEITNGDQVQEGDELSFTANPTDGQIVDEWTVNGKEVSNGSGGEPNSEKVNNSAYPKFPKI